MNVVLLSPLSPLSPLIPIQVLIRILRLRKIEYGLTADGKLWFSPISNLRKDLHARFGASIRAQRGAIEWVIKKRQPGWPLYEAWFTLRDWRHLEFVCYRANCDLLARVVGKPVWSFGIRDGKVYVETER